MRASTREDYETRVIRTQLYIQRNIETSRLSLEELAEVACFSPYHFHRIFRAITGESVKEYIRRLRLERAAFQLAQTDRSVLNVALDAGYETHESFTRAFRRRFGRSPSEHRADRKTAHVAAPSTLTATILEQHGENVVEVKVQELEPMLVASVRHTGPYGECHAAWKTLCGDPAVAQTFGPHTKMLGISYDDPDVTDADKIRYDACATILEEQEFGEGVSTQTVAGGRYAVAIHNGSYNGLADCYKYLYGQWLPDSGYEPAMAPCIEVYLTNPETTPEDEAKTEIRIPLKS